MKRTLLYWFCLVMWLPAAVGADEAVPGREVFRLGVSHASFGRASRNDASAALKVWVAAAVRERKLDMNIGVEVFDRGSDLRAALERSEVEAVSMNAEEFFQSGLRPDHIFVGAKSTGHTERYVVVAHTGSGVNELRDLKGRKLVRHSGSFAGPGVAWLFTTLAGQGLGNSGAFFREIAVVDNPNKPLLQVYFRQAEACLTTTNAFEVACELNPQLRRQLKIVAVSPPMIPSLFFFRPNYSAPERTQLEQAIIDLAATAAGQQVLTVFQCSHMQKIPVSSFDATRRVLEEYQRLTGPTQSAGAVANALPEPNTRP
jgi:phosphonate transport system substrate-binding protein